MFLKRQPQGVITESHVRIYGPDLAAHYGIYDFTLDGKTKVGARFSYTYKKIGGKWLIAEHHSSALPEQPALPSEEEIKNQFNLWNAALATGNPAEVRL